MLRTLLCLTLLSVCVSCKSLRSESSEVKAWELDGNRANAKAFIIQTVLEFYTNIQKDDPVLGQFAEALQDAKTDQTESAEYVLKSLWEQSQSPASPEELTPIKKYIIQEWVTQTNYLLEKDKKTPVYELLDF